MADQHV